MINQDWEAKRISRGPRVTADGSSPLTSTHDLPLDHTAKYDYDKLLKEEVAEYDHVEVTEDLHLGGIHAQKAWHYWFEYLCQNTWKTNFISEVVGPRRLFDERKVLRILSLGCGHGGFELDVAQDLGHRAFELLAVDINPNLHREAMKRAADKGYHVTWETVDLNFIRIPEDTFDVIYAHASLHHVLNLEHICEQINGGLKSGGRFVMIEMIGKTGVLFWPENLETAMEVVRDMPEKYKAGITDPTTVVEPWTHSYVGMEGIRQEDIPSVTMKRLEPVKVFTYGSFVRVICTHPTIGAALDPDRTEDRQYLERVFEYDLELVRQERLRPTEMFAVFKKKA